MNLDDYRAMVAQERESVKEEPQAEKLVEVVEEVVEAKQAEVEEVKPPDEIEIPGVGKVGVDELKNGYLRQSDYTRKTQELAQQRKELQNAVDAYNAVKADPNMAKQLADRGVKALDPYHARIVELETKLYDTMLEKEIIELSSKYQDFNSQEVLQVAYEKKMTNLEDAYYLLKSKKQPENKAIDIDKLKAELREELKKELKGEVDTSTIISSKSPTKGLDSVSPTLNEAQKKVASKMGMSDKEYFKWMKKS